MKEMQFERYRLILKHELIAGEDIHEIERPIVVQYCVDRRFGSQTPILVNEMLERLKEFMLKQIRIEAEGEE